MTFSLDAFLPYLLNQAAETVSSDFEKSYRSRYGMLRTEWRVLFHLGVYGQMTAKFICEKASIHKTKVSRAVHPLEKKRYIERRSEPWSCHGYVPVSQLIYAAFRSNAKGLFPPSDE